MAQKAIGLGPAATPESVLAVARSAVEGRRYLWEGTGPTSALAHQGGKPIRRRRASKLRLGLRVDGSSLVLSKETHGAVGFLVNMGALLAMRASREFRKVCRAIEGALADADLLG
ncbi:MAG: hypothetical protein QM662_04115 [Gordonia sp. (in: high G+C Gram-positive bacteria)]